MTEPMKRIEHQADVQDVIDHAVDADNTLDIAAYASRGTATIAAPTAPGATYSQAEAASMKTAVDAIRAQLTAHGITA